MKHLLARSILLLSWLTYALHEATPERCVKPPVVGICRQFNRTFYFDYSTYKCMKLKKGQCIGGNNHFSSQMRCQKICIRVEGKKEARCMETAQTCNCTADMQSWFFDYKRSFCRMYNHSKCAGGMNRFYTEEDCMRICKGMPKPKVVCSVSLRTNRLLCLIEKLRKRWYFDTSANTCRQSKYKKCGKWPNSFATFQKCMDRCSYTGCQKCNMGVPYYFPNGTTPCGAEPE